MILLAKKEQIEILTDAVRAPSAHNTQPARWRFCSDGRILLIEDRTRCLPISDPDEKDHRISLGAAFEGFHLAATKYGYKLATPIFADHKQGINHENHKIILTTWLESKEGQDPDELAYYVNKRNTYRNNFAPMPASEREKISKSLSQLSDILLISNPSDIDQLAKLHDQSSLYFLKDKGYYRELYSWLRFRRTDPLWDVDGLNGEAMGLSLLEGYFAPLIMNPAVFNMLCAMGLGAFLVSEKQKTKSASFLVLCYDDSECFFTAGRNFYRTWLRLTSLGLSCCPMSALVDNTESKEHLQAHWSLGAKYKLVNILRVGPALEQIKSKKSRLSVSAVIV